MDVEAEERLGRSRKEKSKWVRFQEIIWDGEREPEERRLVQKLDIYLLSVPPDLVKLLITICG